MGDQEAGPVGVVLVSHGALALGLKEAAEMIAGPQDGMALVMLGPAEDLDVFRLKLEAAVADVDRGRGVLLLVDLFGGSPGNTAAYLMSPRVEVVTGVSLPMLLEVLMNRAGAGVTELAQTAMQAGKDGVLRFAEMLGG